MTISKQPLLRFLGWLTVALTLRGGTQPLYVNNGLVDSTPTIDAKAFLNNGTFNVSGLLVPYTTQNTFSYTNRGSMASKAGGYSGGFDFEHVDGSTGIRSWASTFINYANASVTVESANYGPYLFIRATNLVNHGTLSAPSTALIRLEASKMDLSGGIVEIDSSAGTGTPGYSQKVKYAEVTNTIAVDPTGIIDVRTVIPKVISPTYTYEDPNGNQRINGPLQIFNPLAFVYTNQVDTNRQLIQVVFVQPQTDTNININVSFDPFVPNVGPSTNFNTVYVQYYSSSTNIITGNPDLQGLVIQDGFGFAGAAVLNTNPFGVSTTTLTSFGSGASSSNAAFRKDLFTTYYDTNFPKGLTLTNVVTTNTYTATKVTLNSLGSAVPNVSGATVTNLPGRVEINAGTLNLKNARIRGQGVLNVRAESITNSASALVEAPYLYYDLGGSTGTVSVQNLIGAGTVRFADGTLEHLSILFTNQMAKDIVSTNTMRGGDTNTPENVTNTVVFEADYHLVFVSGLLKATRAADVYGLTVRGKDSSISDDVTPDAIFQVLSQSFTLNSQLNYQVPWVASNAPNLLYFTNNGILKVPNGGNFGADRAVRYSSWVNNGTTEMLSLQVNSAYFENNGTFADPNLGPGYRGLYDIQSDVLKFDGGTLTGTGDVNLRGGSLKLRNATITSKGAIGLNFTDNISDAGISSPSAFSAPGGYTLGVKPAQGDILGTTLSVVTPQNGSSTVVWAGEDRGATARGFLNNAAIGELNLLVGNGGVVSFSGTGASNGLYVDRLVLDPGTASALSDTLFVDDNLVIYFADSNVAVDQLDGALNGHLRWVGAFAGPQSGVTIAVENGGIVFVNRNLVTSTTVDSNGNGVVNALDPAPFDIPPVTVTTTPPPNRSSVITWTAAANTVYHVDYSSAIVSPTWTLLGSLTNTLSVPTQLSISDPIRPAGQTRFYRVRYQP